MVEPTALTRGTYPDSFINCKRIGVALLAACPKVKYRRNAAVIMSEVVVAQDVWVMPELGLDLVPSRHAMAIHRDQVVDIILDIFK